MQNWHPLASRSMHVAWSTLASRTIDPYIVWADATAFAGLTSALARADPSWDRLLGSLSLQSVPIAFEFRPRSPKARPALAKARKTLRQFVPTVLSPIARIGSRFGTAHVPIGALKYFFDADVQRFFVRIELGLPTRTPADPKVFADALAHPTPLPGGHADATKVFAAVIDDGCAFANDAFLANRLPNPPTTRIERLWFQEDRVLGPNPNGIGFTAPELNTMLAAGVKRDRLDEAACYAAMEQALRQRTASSAADDWKTQMRAGAAHGTHVLDVVAGESNPLASSRYRFGQSKDRASSARIIFVQLPRAAVTDTSGASMTTNVLEALAYIGGAIGPKGKVVVNLSYGALAGPHDGTTLLEEAMDDLRTTDSRFLSIVLPAGNGYDSRTHACVLATNDARWHDMPLQLLPNDPTDTYVELWYSPFGTDAGSVGKAAIDIEVVAPDGSRSTPVSVGEFVELRAGVGPPLAAIVHIENPTAGGGTKHMALLAIAPTQTDPKVREASLHGVWTVRVRNRGGLPIAVNAWIERDDSAFGSGRSRSQATFLSRGAESEPGHPHAATFPVDRRSSLNSFAHGAYTLVVGGCSLRPLAVADYSGSGPGRKGLYQGPDIAAPCEDTPGSGIFAAGTRTSQPAEMNGTSVAAAVFSRQCVNAAATRSCLPEPDPDVLNPKPAQHPGGIDYPELKLRRGRGLLKPMP
jgi:Subtilase family